MASLCACGAKPKRHVTQRKAPPEVVRSSLDTVSFLQYLVPKGSHHPAAVCVVFLSLWYGIQPLVGWLPPEKVAAALFGLLDAFFRQQALPQEVLTHAEALPGHAAVFAALSRNNLLASEQLDIFVPFLVALSKFLENFVSQDWSEYVASDARRTFTTCGIQLGQAQAETNAAQLKAVRSKRRGSAVAEAADHACDSLTHSRRMNNSRFLRASFVDREEDPASDVGVGAESASERPALNPADALNLQASTGTAEVSIRGVDLSVLVQCAVYTSHSVRTLMQSFSQRLVPALAGSQAAELGLRTLELSPDGTEISPAHRNSFSVVVTDMCPDLFACIRKLYGVDEVSFLKSIVTSVPYEKFDSNSKSGEFFSFTPDSKYLVKTISEQEARILLKMLPDYVAHLAHTKRSMLVRFFGLFKMVFRGRNIHLIIMPSVFDTSVSIHETFDLKGSTLNRGVKSQAESVKKDNDWVKLGRRMALPKDAASEFLAVHVADVNFLARWNVMDYSCLIGIHTCPGGVPLFRRAVFVVLFAIRSRGTRCSWRFSHQSETLVQPVAQSSTAMCGVVLDDVELAPLAEDPSSAALDARTGPPDVDSAAEVSEQFVRSTIKPEPAIRDGPLGSWCAVVDDTNTGSQGWFCCTTRSVPAADEAVAPDTGRYPPAPVTPGPGVGRRDVAAVKFSSSQCIVSGALPVSPVQATTETRQPKPVPKPSLPPQSAPALPSKDDVPQCTWRCDRGMRSCGSRRQIYFVGIIDFLIEYTMKKKVEHKLKVAQGHGLTASCVPPDDYAARQVRFVTEKVVQGVEPQLQKAG
mmetsp:Transcript_34952/g.91470  ORF Transcript_34952/g.91470 Transcript_34952/m.91470 type:complete len:809 (+) Transcript_34952:21-2447(+)